MFEKLLMYQQLLMNLTYHLCLMFLKSDSIQMNPQNLNFLKNLKYH
jgi:hypothetical protein